MNSNSMSLKNGLSESGALLLDDTDMVGENILTQNDCRIASQAKMFFLRLFGMPQLSPGRDFLVPSANVT